MIPTFLENVVKQGAVLNVYKSQPKAAAVPVEVKAGAKGTLKSLHQFINRCPHGFAVRLYAGPLELVRTTTPEGKPFTLLNLPYCLAGKLRSYIRWLIGGG